MKVAFLGLGVMGFPMAGHLQAAGHEVRVFNRTKTKADAWSKQYGCPSFADAGAAIDGAEIIFACLGDDPDVIQIVEAIETAIQPGAIFVDHTTSSPTLARRLAAEFKQRRVGFIDAPVSGGEAGAINGQLSVMCGGEAVDLERVRPVMEAYAARIVHVGPSGHGQLCKAVNQICIAGVVQGLSEGVHFAERAGLDMGRVFEAISGGAAQSWQMENRMKTMAVDEFEFGFAVDWMRKDLRIALSEARESGATLPVTALVDQFYAEVQSMGGGRWDTSSLARRLKRDPKV